MIAQPRLSRARLRNFVGARLSAMATACLIWVTLGVAQPELPPIQTNFKPMMTDGEVRETITQLVAPLSAADATPIQKVEALRTWLHELLPVADSHCNLGNQGVNHNRDPLGKLIYLAESRTGGYYCGGQAEIARQVFELMGFRSLTLNVGIDGSATTHVTTFVELDISGIRKWTMQDVYFDCTLRDSQGAYIGYRELLHNLEHGTLEEIVVDERAESRTPYLNSRWDRMPRNNRRYDLDAECGRQWDGFDEFTVRWDFRLFRTSMFELRRHFRARLGSENPLYLFVMPLSYKGPSDARSLVEEAIESQNKVLKRLGLPPDALTKPVEIPLQQLEPID